MNQVKGYIKKNYIYILLCLLLLPLTKINTDNYHDWGDDFAAYLSQAKAIAEGHPYHETGFVPNAEKPDMKAAPPGWSLMLLPLYIWGNPGIADLHIYLSCWLILWGMLLFHFAKKYIGHLAAGLFSLCICWHPEMIVFKSEILSDIPFAALLTLLIILTHQEYPYTYKKIIGLAVLSGFLGFMRTTGILTIPALALHLFYLPKQTLQRNFIGLYIIIGVSTFVVLQYGLFAGGGIINAYGSYLQRDWLEEIRLNLAFYANGWRQFNFLDSTGLAVILLLAGMIYYLSRNKNLAGWYVIGYLIVILIWPFRNQGFRYLYPVLPLILLMVLCMFHCIPKAGKYINIILLGLMLCVVTGKTYTLIQENYRHSPYETDAPESQELFRQIKTIAGNQEIVVFTKARALCYFSGVHSMYPVPSKFEQDYSKWYQKYQARWFISTKIPGTEVYNPAYEKYIKNRFLGHKPVWENGLFAIYRVE